MRTPHPPPARAVGFGRSARPARRLLAVGAATLTTILLAIPVSAHAELATATPADTSTVSGSPTEVVMTFTEPVDPAKSSIKLVDAGGKVIVEGSTVDATDAKTMRLPISAPLAAGTYTVRWTTASALDGDLDHGTTTFTVAAAPSVAPSSEPASVAPTVAASAPPSTPATSAGDAVIPVVVALVVLAGLGVWLMRGRARGMR